MDGTQLAALAGLLLSLLFSYTPKLKTWFEQQGAQEKRLVMLASLATVALISYGLSCAGWWPQISCNEAGVKTLIEAFIAALVANQATFLVSPKPAKQPPQVGP